ncbi:MAG: glutamine--fructose-6-phosphate transaminase (isomerizing) [Candidatus Taylorbacteria bacterium]|nr:glutamine--fructose-6-phosphate transaminase (isomerizing) [Candidatus Taylorbacteria bacterium]
MCGIIAYIGKDRVKDVLLDGLEALEYRGYDSAGLYIAGAGPIKAVGPVANLRKKAALMPDGNLGIAHTRWATHGKPSEANAHPHTGRGSIWAVHNGIIENHSELRQKLMGEGRVFASETDSEVVPHLIERAMERGASFEDAVFETVRVLKGAFGLAIAHRDAPDRMVAVRMGSPLVIGVARGGRIIASDAAPVIRHTRDVVYLKDGDVAIVSADSHRIFSFLKEAVSREGETVPFGAEEAKRGGYEHFMLKEIMEGPEVLRNAIRGRIAKDGWRVKLGGLESNDERLRSIERVVIAGCGTSYYAGVVGKYLIESLADIPVEADIASELRYREPILTPKTLLIALSQSGETADTLEAVREAKRKGAFTLGIVNVVGSSIARETDAGIYNHAGPEVSVASTKAFISQTAVLALVALFLGSQRNLGASRRKEVLEELSALPEKMERILANRGLVERIAKRYAESGSMLYIGRKYMMPLAYEGALKLKEVSYIHAEGYGAGELKHGPLALVSESFPVFALAPRDSVYEKTLSNMEEVRARGADVIALVTEGDAEASRIAKETIEIPETIECLYPALAAVPLQLFAYYAAVARGLNVDRPRNLAKSVTVE